MPTDVEVLTEMGFSENRAQKALAKTGYKGVQVAMDWLFAHSDDPDIDDPMPVSEGRKLTGETSENAAGAEAAAEASAKSLKCDECGKLLRTENDVQMHAARTNHSQFSESTEEIKPLTEEEKKAQLAQVQDLIKKKRQEKEEKEKQEQILKEKARRTQGKEMIQMKQKHEEDEMKKIMEQRRREKEEEKLAKQRVRDQIEKDKQDRAKKFGTAEQQTSGDGASVTGGVASSSSSTNQASAGPKEYQETRLQVMTENNLSIELINSFNPNYAVERRIHSIRLPSGETLTQTFKVGEELSAVRLFVSLNRKDGDTSPFTFKTAFPPKTFSDVDMQAALNALGSYSCYKNMNLLSLDSLKSMLQEYDPSLIR